MVAPRATWDPATICDHPWVVCLLWVKSGGGIEGTRNYQNPHSKQGSEQKTNGAKDAEASGMQSRQGSPLADELYYFTPGATQPPQLVRLLLDLLDAAETLFWLTNDFCCAKRWDFGQML